MDNLNDSKLEVFKNMKPTFFKSLNGYSLYECPIHGDEETLVVVLPDKSIHYTDLFEVPTTEEMRDMISYGEFNNTLLAWQGNW